MSEIGCHASEITFMVGTMSSGKTTHLLQSHFNLNNAFPNQVMLLNKNDRSGDSVCTNRMGGMSHAHGVTNDDALLDVVLKHEAEVEERVKYVYIDEVQFFSLKQIEELPMFADTYGIHVVAYGLLTTYKGELFPSSKRLLELADKIVQLRNGMRCWCGCPATHNALFKAGKRVSTGDIEVVDNDNVVIDYQVMCRRHFLEHIAFSKGN